MPDPHNTSMPTARRDFIDLWGQMANHWGINRTMAQIHALLMISPDPMPAEQIMDELHISRGNVSMNLRELINWGIVRRTSLPGDRRDFFTTETDVWSMFQIILRERKKRELDPLLSRLDECLAHAGPRHKALPTNPPTTPTPSASPNSANSSPPSTASSPPSSTTNPAASPRPPNFSTNGCNP